MLWGLTFSGYVLFLWPVAFLNHWLLGCTLSRPRRPDGTHAFYVSIAVGTIVGALVGGVLGYGSGIDCSFLLFICMPIVGIVGTAIIGGMIGAWLGQGLSGRSGPDSLRHYQGL